MTEATVAPKKVLTTAEKIQKFYDLSAEYLSKAKALEAEVAAVAAFTNVGAGDIVTFNQGRAETLRTLTGSVLARGVVDGKDVVNVIAGEGLDTKIYQIKVSDLKSVNPDPEATPADDPKGVPTAAEDVNIDDLLSTVSPETEAALNAVQL